MNNNRIEYYQSMIDLNQSDIEAIQLEIHGKQLCDTMNENKNIHALELCIENCKRNIRLLKNN